VAEARRRASAVRRWIEVSFPLFIGLRYLRARKREASLSLIGSIATIGIALGVMTLNVVLSVMSGFESDLRDRILGLTPHVTIDSAIGRLHAPRELVARLGEVTGVSAVAPFAVGQVVLSSGDELAGVELRGVDTAGGATDLARHVVGGDLSDLARDHPVADSEGVAVRLPGIVLGRDVAGQLRVGEGDPVTVVSPQGVPTALGMVPRVKRFVVVGVFRSGMSEYDATRVFVHLPEAQRFFRLGEQVSGIEVRLEDAQDAALAARRMAPLLDVGMRVSDWMETNSTLFSALQLEKTVYFIVLLLIVLVAAFNIVATLIMVVMNKRKDIAVLKSMGAGNREIAAIFVWSGLLIGIIGAAGGSVAGLALCWALDRYEFVELPPDVFYVSTLPVEMSAPSFLGVSLVALAICVLASVYPANRAARLAPVDVIRHE
jgi:lipoprotein-releasing system permease protein